MEADQLLQWEKDLLRGCVTFGPLGGSPGGKPWSILPEHGFTEVAIVHGSAVRFVVFKSDNFDLSRVSEWVKPGEKMSRFALKDGEHFTGVTGTYGFHSFGGQDGEVIRSLIFRTNMGQYGPYGVQSGSRFLGGATNGKIMGFTFYQGSYLHAVSFFIKAVTDAITHDFITVPNNQPVGSAKGGGACGLVHRFCCRVFSAISKAVGKATTVNHTAQPDDNTDELVRMLPEASDEEGAVGLVRRKKRAF